jgi:O-antigen ligase
MWKHLFGTYFTEHPYLGYGFNAFWYLYSHRKAMQVAAGYPDPIVIADNGFVDILINNGVIGFLLFLILYIGIWYRSLSLVTTTKQNVNILPLIVMAFTLISNVSWSLLFENEAYIMLIMMIVLFACKQQKISLDPKIFPHKLSH